MLKICTLLPILFFTGVSSSFSQPIMTIGEVFDYNVSDVFQYTGELSNNAAPPTQHEIRILEKQYLNDTLYYTRLRQRSSSEVVWDPDPHMVYHFYSVIDTISYINIDSLITTYDYNFESDTLIYYSDDYCGVLINGHVKPHGGPFEAVILNKQYGKGLGMVDEYTAYPDNGYVGAHYYMTYYKKGTLECGLYDTLMTSVNAHPSPINVSFYPNPATNTFQIQTTVTGPVNYTIYNVTGSLLQTGSLTPKKELDVSGFTEGVYVIQLQTQQGVVRKKFVISK